jgi:molecular chaperone DnaK
VPKIDVTFDIDANGILNVAAKDQATGASQSISITGSTRLSEEDKKRMVDEAEQYAEADKARRETADKLNSADAICYQGEKMLADFGDKLDASAKDKIEAAIKDTKEAIDKKDAGQATSRAEALSQVLQEAGAGLYAQTQEARDQGAQAQTAPPHAEPNVGGGNGEARPSGSGPRGKVVDAEFREGD